MQTILLAVAADPSPVAVASRAAMLARRTGARIVLLHVDAPDTSPTDWDDLQRSLAPLLEGVTVEPMLRRGHAAHEILGVARAEKADLILMTRHVSWTRVIDVGLNRFLLHSVVCRVLLDASCPVWVEPGSGAPTEIEHVLCGVASLFLDRDLIGHAAATAAQNDAGLILFRSAISAVIAIPGQSERSEEWQAEVKAVARADLEALRAQMGVPADISVGVGNFTVALLEGAQTSGAGLIMVRRTSRDWGRDETLFPLVRGASVPVLVCPDARQSVARAPDTVRQVRASRLTGRMMLVVGVLFGLWLVHRAFSVVSHPDICATHPYGCAFEEGMKKTTGARPKEPGSILAPEK